VKRNARRRWATAGVGPLCALQRFFFRIRFFFHIDFLFGFRHHHRHLGVVVHIHIHIGDDPTVFEPTTTRLAASLPGVVVA
jgi:hypothetical protein